jgi:ribose-phosphate pyrophosphokinase
MKIFSGTSHPALSEEVAKIIGLPLAKAEVVRFTNSEVKVTIQEDVKDETCVVIQTTSNPSDTNLMELFFFCDALKRSEAKKVIAVVPYLAYARQNIQHRPGEDVSLNLIIRFLESVGFSEVYVFDIHDEGSEGIFSIPFKNLSALPTMGDEIKNYLGRDFQKETITIVSPDQGGIERARDLGEYFFGDDEFNSATINKKRDEDHIHQSEALVLYGDVKDKVAVIVDDICTSGGTLIHAADLCMKNGAKKVIAAITHHDFSPGVSENIQNSSIEKFFTSNSMPLPKEYVVDKLQEVSIASVIADTLKKI